MTQDHRTANADSRSDAQIGALLMRVENSFSVVDQLMAIPVLRGEDESEAPEWEAAVAKRLQARLVSTMRSMIESEPERKRA